MFSTFLIFFAQLESIFSQWNFVYFFRYCSSAHTKQGTSLTLSLLVHTIFQWANFSRSMLRITLFEALVHTEYFHFFFSLLGYTVDLCVCVFTYSSSLSAIEYVFPSIAHTNTHKLHLFCVHVR